MAGFAPSGGAALSGESSSASLTMYCTIRVMRRSRDQAVLLSDKVGALERLGGDEDLLWELCQIFLGEFPKLLQKLKEAIANGQSDGVMRAAHGLKGELGYLGATKAVQAARELEDMGHEKDLSRAAEVFAVLDKEFAGLHRTLKRSAGAES
jgi:HPt (histidine-containing phosphotransfer) domain-containing protein